MAPLRLELLLVLALPSCGPPGTNVQPVPDAGVVEPMGIDDGGVSTVTLGAFGAPRLELLRTSVTAFHWQTAWNQPAAQPITRPMIDRTLQTRLGIVLLEHEWANEAGVDEPSEPQANALYEARYATVLADVLDHGGTVLFQVVGPPRWASSSSSTAPIVPGQNERAIWSVAPPSATNDYARWRSATRGFVRWLMGKRPTELAAGRLLFVYGAELNNEEFFGDLRLYAPAWNAFAEAVRSVSSAAPVGGGGRLDGVSPKTKPTAYASAEPVMHTWLAGCRALGCRIDFVYGHNFTMSPVAWATDGGLPRDDFSALMAELQAVSAPHGYANLPIILTDWTSWEFKDLTRHPWLSSEHDTEYRAAHLTASLTAMQRAGFRGQTLGALFETVSSITDEFSGDWGLFSRRGITKPSFHAASLASRLADGRSFETHSSDPFVSALASDETGTARVLLTRFVPDTTHGAHLLLESLASRLVAEGYDDAKLTALGCPLASLQQLARTLDRSQCATARPPLSTTLDAWFDLLNTSRNEPVRRTVRVRIPWSGSSVTATLSTIDATHANASAGCLANPQQCTDVQAVNAGAGALPEERASAKGDAGFVDLELSLGRRHVTLVTLTP